MRRSSFGQRNLPMQGAKLMATLRPGTAEPVKRSLEQDHSVELAVLAAILESSDDAIVGKTLAGEILSWSAGATRIFGYRPEEVLGKPITIIIPPELHPQEQQILERLQRGERIDHLETVRVARD